MAVKIAKIQLEMKNGVKVRTLEELKEHYDVQKLVGYYLDGKLKKWLESRWYKEEKSAIERLNPTDPLLTKHLCEIFEIEDHESDIDLKKVAERNLRISKLKQYTDDESIIQHIDAVAFNQDELKELYNQNIETIYLCEGAFKVPKSKRDLRYVKIGEAQVEGLKMKKEKLVPISEIPEELADYIGYKTYVELDDYVWLMEHTSFMSCYEVDNIIKPFFESQNASKVDPQDRCKIWNKRTGEYTSYYDDFQYASFLPYGNKIIYEGYKKNFFCIYLYDILTHERKLLYSEGEKPSIHDFVINNDKVAFNVVDYNKAVINGPIKKIIVLDLISNEIVLKISLNPDTHCDRGICLCNEKLFYYTFNKILQYDFETKKVSVAYKHIMPKGERDYFDRMSISKMSRSGRNLYVIFSDYCEKRTKIIKIKPNGQVKNINCDCIPDNKYVSKIYENNKEQKENSYLAMLIDSRMYVLDMLNDKVTGHDGAFPSSININMIGNKLYWENDDSLYKVDLTKGWNPVVVYEKMNG